MFVCLFVQMGQVKQRTRQSREASALGGEANARRRLRMQTEKAIPAGSIFPDEVVETMRTDFGEPLGGMATCGGDAMRTGGVLLQGDCVDGTLALLSAKALCRVVRTCRGLELRMGACSAWSKVQTGACHRPSQIAGVADGGGKRGRCRPALTPATELLCVIGR